MDYVPNEMVKKLILLFVLDRMEIPLTEESVMDICTNRNSWLGYLDCKEALNQLLKVNFVCKLDSATEGENKDERYAITNEGRNCVANFFERIRKSTREEISEYAKQNRMVFKRNQEYVCEYFKNKDGTHTVVFRIKQPELTSPFFEIRLRTSTRKEAVLAAKKWREKAAQVYEYINENLIEEN